MTPLTATSRGLARKQSPVLTAIFVVCVTSALLSSFFTTVGTPILLVAIVLGVFFLPQFKEVFVLLFPIALINPQLRLGASGMVISEARSFHPINVNMTEVFIGGMLLAWLLSGRDRQGERAGNFLNVPVLLLGLLALIGMVTAVDKSSGIKIGVEKMIEPLVLFFAITHKRWSRQQLRTAASVLIAVGAIVALKSVYDYYFGPPPEPKVIEGRTAVETTRLKSYWAATNVMAALFGLLIPLGFLRTFYQETARARLWAAVAVGALCFGLTITETRTGWVAVGIILVFLSLRFARGWILVAATTVLVISYGTGEMLKRAHSLLHITGDVSFQGRLVVWSDSLGMILHSPLFGIGFGSFQQVYRSPIPNVHPHNDLLTLGVDMGALAPILYLIILLRIVRVCQRALRLATNVGDRVMLWGFLGGIGSTFIQSQMASLLNWSNFGLAYWYFLALTVAYARSLILDAEDARMAAAPAGAGPVSSRGGPRALRAGPGEPSPNGSGPPRRAG